MGYSFSTGSSSSYGTCNTITGLTNLADVSVVIDGSATNYKEYNKIDFVTGMDSS